MRGSFLKLTGYFLPAVLLYAWGCAGHNDYLSSKDNPARLVTIRHNNAQKEFASVHGMTGSLDAPTAPNPDIAHPLTLEKAISHALKFNLDAVVKQLEIDIKKEAALGARLKMLPSLNIEGELSRRDNYDASYSDPLFDDGGQNYNYSRDRSTQAIYGELSWDLLNFGIAYYQKRQSANQYEIAKQQRRRTIQNLKFDVVKAYWKMVAAQKSKQMAENMVQRLAQRERILQKQLESRTASELESLETSVILSEMQMVMSGFEKEFQRHQSDLATLMGLPANTQLELAEVDFDPVAKIKPVNIEALETETLRLRPELYEQDMEELITSDQARIAVAQTFPRPSLFYRYSYDADSHLYNNQWQQAGIRLTFDLLSVPQKLSQKRETAIAQTMIQTRRRAIAAAVITQLHIAVIDFQDAAQAYRQSKKIAAKRALLTEARLRHAELGNSNYEEVIKNQARYLLAQSRHLFSYAEWMITEQRILNTIGRDDIGAPQYIARNSSAPSPEIIACRNPITNPLRWPDESIQPKTAETIATLTVAEKTSEKIPVAYRTTHTPLPYSLQLASFRRKEDAQRMIAGIGKKGIDAFIAKATVAEMGVRWRCFEGCYRSMDEARIAKEIYGLSNAIVMKTPYTIHIDSDPTAKGKEEMTRKLIGMGYFPYFLKGEDAGYRMFVGALSYREAAEAQVEELSAGGIRARVVRR